MAFSKTKRCWKRRLLIIPRVCVLLNGKMMHAALFRSRPSGNNLFRSTTLSTVTVSTLRSGLRPFMPEGDTIIFTRIYIFVHTVSGKQLACRKKSRFECRISRPVYRLSSVGLLPSRKSFVKHSCASGRCILGFQLLLPFFPPRSALTN